MPTESGRESADRATRGRPLALDDARARIVELATTRSLPGEAVAIEQALGRVLAEDVAAPFDVPGFANSAMDGYALRHADLSPHEDTRLRLVGVALAGGPAAPVVAPGTCVRITTGARLPEGADTVAIKEYTTADGDAINIAPGTRAGANVRPAGEDYRAGDRALTHGLVLTPARIGALASFGMRNVTVARRARAVLLTTGDELIAPGMALGAGQIYDSNRYSLGALLAHAGAELVRHERLRDEPATLRAALLRAGAEADIVLTSGGVSAGEADYLPALLGEIGTVLFWKVRIKPGLPFLCASIGQALVFALPGNPVSGMVTFQMLVRPAIDALAGYSESPPRLRARLAEALHKRHDRTELLRATLACDDQGVLHATPLPKQGSGMVAGMAGASVLVRIPEAAGEYAAGTVVDVLPLPYAFD